MELRVLAVGDVVLVRPGGSIPADGRVTVSLRRSIITALGVRSSAPG